MTEPLTLAAAARSLRRLAPKVGGATMRARIGRLAQLAAERPDELELSFGVVVDELFGAHTDGVTRFREWRDDLRTLAQRHGVEIECKVDGNKRAAPHARRCWFEGLDDEVALIEELSWEATEPPPGTRIVAARARRAILRVCIDGPDDDPLADELANALADALRTDRDFDVELTATRLGGGEPLAEREQRLASAELVVCLLTNGYLRERADGGAADGQVVVPIALRTLSPRADLGRFGRPFTYGGKSFFACRRRDDFVAELHELLLELVLRPERALVEAVDAGGAPAVERRARQLLARAGVPAEEIEALDEETALALLERADLPENIVLTKGRVDSVRSTAPAREDAAVDVQAFMRAWVDEDGAPPLLVVFGEYGIGKTTACGAFARALVERRRAGDGAARLPIFLDLRNLGANAATARTLEEIIDAILARTWQTGRPDRPSAHAIVAHVQRSRAVAVFDGLDEVLVHLPPERGRELVRTLWGILPPKLHGEPGAGRVVMTCRTHFFRTLSEQRAYFRGEDRDAVGARDYAALHVLPFSDEQVRAYLRARAERDPGGGGEPFGVERALEVIRTVHNLSELVARPYNLRLVADRLGALERRIASGARVDAAALYDDLVAEWLNRDGGKHKLRRDDKPRLMEELAAELWRDGARSLPVDRLEAWLNRRLSDDPERGRWFTLARPDVALLAEDLRTATFVVRPGAEAFEFAHTSMLEYFLARRLARALAVGDLDAWALPPVSVETLDFLAEIVAAGDTPGCLCGLRALRDAYRPQASELAFAYCLRALERGAPAPGLAGFALDGARLRGVRVRGPADGPLLSLAGCSLRGADLRAAWFERARLERCDLRGADLTRAELHGCVLDRAALDGAVLAGTIARDCRARGLDARGARARRAQWLRCDLTDARWPADANGHLVAAPVSSEPPPAPQPHRIDTFTGHTDWVRAVAFAPAGDRLASAGDDGSVRIWDPASGDELQRLTGHTRPVSAVAFAPAGDRLASAGHDDSVRIWDPASGDELQRLTGGVSAVAFAPAGDRLASAGHDGSVRIWDPASGDELQRLTGHTDWVSAVAFAPAGDRLASAGYDGSVRIWDPATGDELLAVQLLPAGEHAVLAGGRVASCTAGAWRWLGWLAREPESRALTRLPAETYGPLPVRAPRAT